MNQKNLKTFLPGFETKRFSKQSKIVFAFYRLMSARFLFLKTTLCSPLKIFFIIINV